MNKRLAKGGLNGRRKRKNIKGRNLRFKRSS